jgi:hypothetical protein
VPRCGYADEAFAGEGFGREAERADVVGVRDFGWAGGAAAERVEGVSAGGRGVAGSEQESPSLLFLYYTLAVWNFTARLASMASRTTTSSTPLRTRSRPTLSKATTTSLAEHWCSAPTGAGNLLELVVLELDDGRRLVIHAMSMRPAYRDLLPQPDDA